MPLVNPMKKLEPRPKGSSPFFLPQKSPKSSSPRIRALGFVPTLVVWGESPRETSKYFVWSEVPVKIYWTVRSKKTRAVELGKETDSMANFSGTVQIRRGQFESLAK